MRHVPAIPIENRHRQIGYNRLAPHASEGFLERPQDEMDGYTIAPCWSTLRGTKYSVRC